MTKFMTLLLLIVLLTSCSENKIVYVAPALQNCGELGDKKCLLIKENKEDDWTEFDGEIAGFEYKEGALYKIEVKISKAKKSENNNSDLRYELVKIIYRESSKIVIMPNSQIVGNWKVTSMTGVDSLPVQPTLSFADGKVSGNAGCNNYNANCTLDGDTMSVGLAIATKMYCTNMKIEKAFFNCLQNTRSYKISDGVLIIYDENKNELMSCLSDN